MYEVLIDSSLEDGYLTYGEYLHKGETADEFLLLATSAMTGRIRCSTLLIVRVCRSHSFALQRRSCNNTAFSTKLGAAICEESQGGPQRPAQRAATPNAIAIAAAVQWPALGRTPPIARWYGSYKWNTCGPERLTVCKQRHQLEI